MKLFVWIFNYQHSLCGAFPVVVIAEDSGIFDKRCLTTIFFLTWFSTFSIVRRMPEFSLHPEQLSHWKTSISAKIATLNPTFLSELLTYDFPTLRPSIFRLSNLYFLFSLLYASVHSNSRDLSLLFSCSHFPASSRHNSFSFELPFVFCLPTQTNIFISAFIMILQRSFAGGFDPRWARVDTKIAK